VGILEWATDPWGRQVPIHAAWSLIWVSIIGGLLFLIVHSIYVKFLARTPGNSGGASPELLALLPPRVPRHSLAARLFHWIMAAAMFVLLFTGFLPKIGIQINWVTYHWIAGVVLTASILFHIIHASFFLDFWSIWPDKTDLRDGWYRVLHFFGKPAPAARKSAKYPLDNKLYHAVIILCGLSVVLTGVFMMFRVRTGILPRNPYLFGDMTWGWMYSLHGLAGIGLIALVIVHVYFAVRPEKLPITAAMIVGTMDRDFYLKEHDPERWVVDSSSAPASKGRGLANAG
jgi:cytochrome b subunit of formate dehydrogenase